MLHVYKINSMKKWSKQCHLLQLLELVVYINDVLCKHIQGSCRSNTRVQD